MGKDSFILYKSDLKGLEFLTDNQIGKLFRAIAKLQLDEEEPNLGTNPAVNILFNQIRAHIEINEEKYEETCKKKSAAMKKRWADSKSTIENYSTLPSTIEDYKALSDNDNDNDNENDNENENDNDACGAKRENKRKNYYNKNTPRLLQDEPSYDINAFTRKGIGFNNIPPTKKEHIT